MIQTAGFDPNVIPVGPSEGRRQAEREPDSARITPLNESEEARADSRRADPNETPAIEPLPRVAFTAKFGPDKDGFPLQLVRGDDVTAAERIDFEVIAARRLSRADREVLLRAQERQTVKADTVARQTTPAEADQTEATARNAEAPDPAEKPVTKETETSSGSTVNLEV